jgi:hypothetical protein
MSVMVHGTFLGRQLAIPVQLAVSDIRTRAVASVERSIAKLRRSRVKLACGTRTLQRTLKQERLAVEPYNSKRLIIN